ncbi:hypothetical protein AB0M12_04365 [Nocardia vinacea]|uniref:hypothetical protein n=1 Tax=Nocardia vinacea TaxID=96468 RepID=UPI003423377E
MSKRGSVRRRSTVPVAPAGSSAITVITLRRFWTTNSVPIQEQSVTVGHGLGADGDPARGAGRRIDAEQSAGHRLHDDQPRAVGGAHDSVGVESSWHISDVAGQRETHNCLGRW